MFLLTPKENPLVSICLHIMQLRRKESQMKEVRLTLKANLLSVKTRNQKTSENNLESAISVTLFD